MIKHEQDSVQREDISFGRDTLGWALWRLSLVLRDIAAANDQVEKPTNMEKEEPPHQIPTEDRLTSGGEEGDPHK